jgi:hypothetical protein
VAGFAEGQVLRYKLWTAFAKVRALLSVLAVISQAISPPPGLGPGSLGREPSILASRTIADSDGRFGRALDCLAVAG